MTNPTVEEAMERLAQDSPCDGVGSYTHEMKLCYHGDLATIRKHIEDLAIEIALLKHAQKMVADPKFRAALDDAGVEYVDELVKQLEIAQKMEAYWRDKFHSRPDQAELSKQLESLMDANIYQQSVIDDLKKQLEELEKALRDHAMYHRQPELTDTPPCCALASSEPETG